MALFPKLYWKSAESADCPNTSWTRAPWLRFIARRPAVISLMDSFKAGLPISYLSPHYRRNGIHFCTEGAGWRDRSVSCADRTPSPRGGWPPASPSRRARHFRGARQLLFKHGAVEALRTLDALQLSVALGLKRAELVTVFVAADQKLCRVATLEGFAVTNPEQPASIVI